MTFRRGALPRAVAAAAVVLLVTGGLVLRLSLSPALAVLEPALQVAVEEARVSGIPAAVFDTTGDGHPDEAAPLVRGLRTMPPEVEVRIYPRERHQHPTWGAAGVIEVRHPGSFAGRRCLPLRASGPSTAVVGWEIEPRLGRWLHLAEGCGPNLGVPVSLPRAGGDA